MSCAEALRRCPHAVFLPPSRSLYSQYSRAVWTVVREVVPTVERTGMDEGYLDLGEVAETLPQAVRPLAEAVQTAVKGATSLSCSLGVGTCKVVAKVASDRRKPGGITIVRPGREAAFLAPFAVRLAARRRPESRGAAAQGRHRDDRRAWRASRTPTSRGSFRARSGGSFATARAGSTRGRSSSRASRSRSATRRPSSGTSPTARSSTPSYAAWPSPSPATSSAEGQVARTVTTKVRYPDFSIRSRSTTAPHGFADAERIGELACALLDRALADRPGALRLVGVSVSNLEAHQQLVLG